MSQDFQLAWPCPHLTVEEPVVLDSDGMTLRTRQSAANSGVVRVLVNNEFFVPQSGLASQATLLSALSGPYDLIPGEDTLVLTTSGGTWSYTFGLRKVTRYTSDQVIQILQRANLEVAFVSNENGHLAFSDTATTGPDSFVDLRGSVAGALGFGVAGVNARQRRARGSLLFPPWDLYTPSVGVRYPRFRVPLKGNPVLKVTYTTQRSQCLRCGGVGFENDVRFDSAGQSLMIQNEDLLNQAALKILLTDKGSNPYHPSYGTDLRSRIGSKAVSSVSTLISEDVRKALAKLQVLQTEQAKYQSISYKERLFAIQRVTVSPHQQDPTAFLVDVTVQNASNKPVTLSIVYAAPQTVALMGSNGLFLGTEAAGFSPDQAASMFLPGRS